MNTKKGYIQLTPKAKLFVNEQVSKHKTFDSLLNGKNSYVLPNTTPTTSKDKIWKANIYHKGKKITKNIELKDALINWYNFYSGLYGIDANVMLAQTYHESNGFKMWTYSNTGALGLTQFTPDTIQWIILDNGGGIEPFFSQEEKNKITKDIEGEISDNVNREKLHQNVIDNPEIMIKAHIRYMKYIAEKKSNNFTSLTLFGYNRGPNLIRKTYLDSIEEAHQHGLRKNKPENNYEKEGINYVKTIFTLLYNSFGYTNLNINETGETIDVGEISILNGVM